MPTLNPYRIFISHAWKYGDDYTRLTGLLDTASLFLYYNYSAPREKPLFPLGTPYTSAEIAQKIAQKISPAQVTLVIAGMYTAYRDWMKYEIDESLRMGKPIIGIKPWGNILVPTYVSQNANIVVGWNTDSIISAIRKYA